MGLYAGLPFSFGLLWAVVAVIASAGAVWSWPLLSMALLARLALGLSVGVGVLQDGQVLRDFSADPAEGWDGRVDVGVELCRR